MANKNMVHAEGAQRSNGAPDDDISTKAGTDPLGRLLTEAQTAERYNLSPKALQARRQRGDPPRYIKLGQGKRAPVRYPEKWIDEDLAAGERTSTSQAPQTATPTISGRRSIRRQSNGSVRRAPSMR
jgi:hypothetical protein